MMAAPEPLEIILKHIEQLREDVREGFERIDGRLTKLEERVGHTEKWQAEKDAVEKALDDQFDERNANAHITLNSRQVVVATIGGVFAFTMVVISVLQVFGVIGT